MLSKLSCAVVGVVFAIGAFNASAETYTTGENAAGATVVAPTIGRTVTASNVSNISNHLDALVGNIGGGFGGGAISSGLDSGQNKQDIALFDSKKQSGLAAGGEERTFSLWANANYTYVDNDKAGTQFDGDVKTINIGGDKKFTDNVLVGVSLGYSKTDIDTTYNSGKYEEDAYTLAGYGLYKFNENLNLSGMVGNTWSSIDQHRQNGATTSDPDAETQFAAATLTGSKKYDKLGLSAHVGYMWANRDTDGYTESDTNVVNATSAKTDQGRVGGLVSYDLQASSAMFSPFLSVDYLHDFSDEINDDSDAFDTGLGLKVSSNDGMLEGFFQVKTQLGREDYSQTSGSAMLRVNF
ncbi:autotransporter outer membrane beta-barrel domain-containing protein [Thalassospira xiamenensis]|uniref:Autotransporter beta-domain-containing protein n=1 Tax=Thalassospira xiamenensis TaxID=220697 RepID=A0A285TXB2_9PROT|nr:autotransporter outer membrane beta-barrel domain-containing protein [Thalassospira xiamenensis]SOC30108.1 Autotransporter beta-domain-containing protein [Thalassospira xiamenensis]